ncbi:pumilio homolog 6, chloroplastic-like [Rutidosis leptorrhynchoides]|uniref:pumilio homolog 6, chloroplastic-like n=1 Tax=Rutidosis leptorrhynchoides TaxID=125765 RepID=UPI003A99232B
MATESPIRMPGASGKWPPSTNVASEELGLLRKGPRFHSSGRDVVPNRSGSAPPSVEGSFMAFGNLISRTTFSPNVNLPNFTGSFENYYTAEEQACADPSYLAYYRSNVNLNPRLPPPVNSTEKRHLAHSRGSRDNEWGLSSMDDNGNGSMRTQAALSTHKEEPEDDQSPKQPFSDVGDRENDFWPGHSEASLPGQDENLVDLVQEDFPQTSAHLYNQSHFSSNCEVSEEAGARDTGSGSLHDYAGTKSNSSPLQKGKKDGSLGSGVNSPGVNIIELKLKGLKVSEELNNNLLQHHVHQQRGNSYQIQTAIPQTSLQGANVPYAGPDQIFPGSSKFSGEAQPVLQTPGFSAPVYANPAPYMTSANPFYPPNPQAAGFYPQYVSGPYPLNSNVVPPFIAGYPPQNPFPLVFEGNPSTNTTVRVPGVPAGGNLGLGADMQHYNKVYGQFGYVQQPSFTDPIYMQYYQQPFAEAYNISAQFDPSAPRSTVFGSQYGTLDPRKASVNAVPMDDQKFQQQSTGRGIMTSHYFGYQENLGMLTQYSSSPLPSPILPASPAGGMGGRNEVRFPVGSGRYTGVYSGWQGQRAAESINDPKIFNFLEELKSGKSRRFELSDIAGHIVEFSADQHGSRFIQQKLEHCSLEEKARVFKEVLPYASKLMTDVFGNYVIQKFFEYGSPEQRKDLANQLVGQILPLSLQMYGCRVIQKALEVIEVEQKVQLVRELDGHVMRCVRDQNGNHVIQKCIESVPAEKIGFIIAAFRGQVAILSVHPYGCRVVQRVLEHCTDELQCQFIVDEILESVCSLAQDQYGNYVTQHVLERGRPNERNQIINKLSGHIVQLSQHKFASNVIEKCLAYGGSAERDIIIREVIGQNDGEDNLLTMMKDQFANYVIQKILETCTEFQREMLLSRIRVHFNALKKYTYGKHIVARFEQQFGDGTQTYSRLDLLAQRKCALL